MLATRVGAGIAAEIGSMVVTEQVDALRMCAADPVDYLIKPRFLASLVMTGALVVLAACVSFASGLVTAHAFFEINPRTFANTSLVDAGDPSSISAKRVAYGAAIPVISGYCGLSTFGGSRASGRHHARGRLVVARRHHPELRDQRIGFFDLRLSAGAALAAARDLSAFFRAPCRGRERAPRVAAPRALLRAAPARHPEVERGRFRTENDVAAGGTMARGSDRAELRPWRRSNPPRTR